MAPTSSMKIDNYRRRTQDLLDSVNDNPTLAGIEKLRVCADGSLTVVQLIQLKGEDDQSCTKLLRGLVDLMENIHHTFKNTRPETLQGSKTKKTTDDFLTLVDSLLSDLCDEFEDNGTPVVPASFAEHEKEIDELKEDLENFRKTLIRRETRASMALQDEEPSRPSTPEKKRSKTSSRSGTSRGNSPMTASPKSTERKLRGNTSTQSPNVKKYTSYGTRRDTPSRKDTPWLETASPVEIVEEEHGGYESPQEDEDLSEPRQSAGHRRYRNANMGRETHPVPPQPHPPMYGVPPNTYPGYYPQDQWPPRAGTVPPNAYYPPQHQPSIDIHGLAMLFGQMQAQGSGAQMNVNSGNTTGNVYENVGNLVIEKRGAGKRGSRKSEYSRAVEVSD